AGKAEEALRRARSQPIERGPEIVVLAFEQIEAMLFALPALLERVFGKRLEIRRMPIANRFSRIARGEPFEGEGADRLQHAEAFTLASHETLVDEAGHGIQRRSAYGLHRFQGKPTGEN